MVVDVIAPTILTTHNIVPPRVYLHFIDRELLEAIGWAPTIAEMRSYLNVLLLALDSPLVVSIPHVWESFALLEPILSEMSFLVQIGAMEGVSSQPGFAAFLASRKELFAHSQERYGIYFRDPPEALLSISPAIVKRSDTTAFLLEHFVDDSRQKGYNAIAEYVARHKDGEHVRRLIEDVLAHRRDQAITYSLFKSILEDKAGPVAAAAARLRISELYTAHYMDFLGADLPTGIPELGFFDGLADHFPLLDIPLLHRILCHLGFEEMLQSNARDSRWWNMFLPHRGSANHLLVVDSVLQVLATIVSQTPVVHRQSQHSLRRYATGILKRMKPLGACDVNVGVQLRRSAAHLRRTLISLGSSYVPDVGRMMMTSRSGSGAGRVLLLTATKTETDAVEDIIAERELVPAHVGGCICYECGRIGPNVVICAQTEMGSVGIGGSLITSVQLINALKPTSVIAVGIGFGLQPDKHKLGQVLVSRQLQGYEAARVGTGIDGSLDVKLRGDKVTAPARLLSMARAAARECNGITTHFGLLMSGEKLVDNVDLHMLLRTLQPEAIGGDMEGYGVYVAASTYKVDWLMVKAICDWGDGKKNSSHQEIAAKNSAKLVLQMLLQPNS